jgi:hypothetical protein
MSDQSWIALAAVTASGILGVASLWFSFWNSSRERQQRLAERQEDNREWYRRTLFEKRLQAIADAYSWVMCIHHASSPDESGIRAQARDWYNTHALFLYESLPGTSEFIGLINTYKTDSNYERQLSLALDEIRGRLEDLRP